MKFPFTLDLLELCTDELRAKMTGVNRVLCDVDRARRERTKVRSKMKVAVEEKGKDGDVEMEVAPVEASGSSAPAATTTTAVTETGNETTKEEKKEDTKQTVLDGELEPEHVYRAREKASIEAAIDPSLKADVGCSVSGLFDLCGMIALLQFLSFPIPHTTL